MNMPDLPHTQQHLFLELQLLMHFCKENAFSHS